MKCITKYLLPAIAILAVLALAGAQAETPTKQEEFTMRITIGEYVFDAALEDNPAANALSEHLPLELKMSELNGNEKYNYLDFELPTDVYSPGQIQAGDIMLYGDSCLVVFYESFSTPYRYTKLGHIEDVTDLRDAVGRGSIRMLFEIPEAEE